MLGNLDPRSTAGILLREFDDPTRALAYAERLGSGTGTMALDYAQAAKAIRGNLSQTIVDPDEETGERQEGPRG